LDPNQELVLEIKIKNLSEPVNALHHLYENETYEMHNDISTKPRCFAETISLSIND